MNEAKTMGEAMAGFLDGPLATLSDEEWEARDRQANIERQRRVSHDADQRRQIVRERLIEAGVGAKQLDAVWGDGFDLEAEGAKALGGFEEDERQIYVLAGGVGSGKTWAAIRWLGEHGGIRPAMLRANAFEAAGRYDKELRRRWQECSALLLDDLGAEYADAKGNLVADLDELMDVFSTHRARLIVTTNLKPSKFRERYGERIVSRLRGHGRWRSLAGGDMRRGS